MVDILDYFWIGNQGSGNSVNDKAIVKFCENHKEGDKYIYQPHIVSRICKRLCDYGVIECIRSGNGFGINDNYLFIPYDSHYSEKRELLKYRYNAVVYGFDYIYELYKDIVLPLVWEKDNGDFSVGTCFKYLNGIVTAKHCITDANNLQIKGYKAADLCNKPIYTSDFEGVDVAFIETGEYSEPLLMIDEGKVMQEVLVMGYPKVPAFTDFLTAEKATISSKASARITPTLGTIAALGYEYLSKTEALLITAKIRGGNSGGPVINQEGCIIGIACQLPNYDCIDNSYDDLGYGIAIPASYIIDIIRSKPKELSIPNGFFKDFNT